MSQEVVVQAVAKIAVSQPSTAAMLEHSTVWPAAPGGSLGSPAPSGGVILVAVRDLASTHSLPLASPFELLSVPGLGCRRRRNLGRRLQQNLANLRFDSLPHGEGHALLLLLRGLLPVEVVPLTGAILVRETHLAGCLGPEQKE